MLYPSRYLAKQEAQETLKKMKSKGWKIHIWENFGWHFSLIKGGMQIYKDCPREYTVLFSERDSGGGSMFWTPENAFRSKDPNKAVAKQLEVARKFVAQCQKAIVRVEKN